jgi:uncharacterized membrane protein HdeD (DUF308 family)
MQNANIGSSIVQTSSGWLNGYYFARFAVAAVWVIAAFTIAKDSLPLAATLLIAYPAWDAVANLIDARHNGGLAVDKTQRLNLVVSALTAIAVAVALGWSMNAVLGVFGIWAAASGLCQLALAVRRRKTYGAQWAMILSGAQSALAGAFFLKMAREADGLTIANVAPYAAFGAFYFLVSALWLTVSDARRRAAHAAQRERPVISIRIARPDKGAYRSPASHHPSSG